VAAPAAAGPSAAGAAGCSTVDLGGAVAAAADVDSSAAGAADWSRLKRRVRKLIGLFLSGLLA
jgi:hypothetical protein